MEVGLVDQENATWPQEGDRETQHQEHLLLTRGELLDRMLLVLPGFGLSLYDQPSVLAEAGDALAWMSESQVDELQALLESLRLSRFHGQ